MLADKLKKSLLQAAIQGKLTKQLSTDDNVDDLLKSIQEEKTKLIKEKKIKKQKTLPEITKEEIPFEIPTNWRWVRLGTILIERGQLTPTEDFSYIDIGSINNKKNILGKCILLSAKEAPSRARKIVEYGDVIYSTVRPYLLNTCIIDREILPKPIVSTGFAVINTNNKLFNQYLFKVLLSPMFNEYANDNENAKGVAYPAISDARLKLALIPIPPLAEQQRIVNKLNLLITKLDELKHDEEKLSILNEKFPIKLKKSLLQAAIQGKLTEQLPTDDNVDDLLKSIQEEKDKLIKEKKIKKQKPLPEIKQEEIPFEIPANWRWVRLGNLCSLITDGTHTTPQYVDKGIPFISIQNISSGKYDSTNLKYITLKEHETLTKRCKPEKGDILLCRIGTLGQPYIVDFDFEFSIFVSLGLIKLLRVEVNKYLYLFMNSPEFDNQINNVKVGGGTHTFKLNLRDINNFLIPLPPLAEQQRIVNKLDKLLAHLN